MTVKKLKFSNNALMSLGQQSEEWFEFQEKKKLRK